MGANKYSVEQPNAASLMGLKTPKDGSFENRIFSYLIISPPGRPINKFKSVREFLETYRDSIKAHRSLYYDGKILHRDISENNIIVTDAEGERDPRGILIDLDLAKELNSGLSGERYRTGTMEFMAIEVLEGRAYTYRYGLESFFYVFLWVVIRYSEEADKNLPKISRLRRWSRSVG
jgi:serine/threonine protein kinase